jgi:hypothetical protein
MIKDIDLVEAFVGFAAAQGGEMREVHGRGEMTKPE